MKRIAAILQRLFPLFFNSLLREANYGNSRVSKSQIASLLQPSYVRVPNGFPIPPRTNGTSRRRKSNRLHLSTKTRNKHR